MEFISTSWESLFKPWILERGENYYCDGNVTKIKKVNDTYIATVEGLDDYCVEITIKNGLILDMDCDCPYSMGGDYCKHEAAVLYKLENEILTLKEQFKKQEEETLSILEDFREKIEKLDKSELVELLVEQAEQNLDLALRFHEPTKEISQTISYGNLDEELNKIRNKADDLFQNYNRVNELNNRLLDLEYDGYSDYYGEKNYYFNYGDSDLTQQRVDDAIADIENFTKELLNNPVIWNHLLECFQLSVELFIKVDQFDDDDLNLTESLIEPLFEHWQTLLVKGLPEKDLEKLRTAYESAIKNTRTYNYNLDDFLDIEMFYSEK